MLEYGFHKLEFLRNSENENLLILKNNIFPSNGL